jgi:hypothetical protein
VPCSSTNWRAKSLTTHMNDGKYYSKLSRSSSFYEEESDLNWICLVILTTKDRLESAFSSIEPTEL